MEEKRKRQERKRDREGGARQTDFLETVTVVPP